MSTEPFTSVRLAPVPLQIFFQLLSFSMTDFYGTNGVIVGFFQLDRTVADVFP